MGRYRQAFWEYGSAAKSSDTSVHTADLNAGNIAAQLALAAALTAALEAVVLGNTGSQEVLATSTTVAKSPSADTGAQRELKWLVSFVDAVNGRGGNFTVPTADPAQLGADGEQMATGALRTAVVDAVEDYVLSVNGNAVTVTSIKLVGRSI